MTDDHTTDGESPDPRDQLMRLTKAQLTDRVIGRDAHIAELQDAAAQLVEERDGARQARRNAIQHRDEHAEGLALARVLNALESLEGGRSTDRGRVLHHYSTPTPEDHAPSAAERVLRHAWMAAGLPDPAAECDRLRDQLRQARAEAADAEDRLERVRQLGAGEEPSF